MERTMAFRWCAVTLIAAIAFAFSPAAAKDYPPNEMPMYGGVTKNAEMIAADEKFIADVLKLGYTRASGSDKAVARGWDFVRQHDIPTAMKRFNQAWLLDPDNGDAFHGFAIVVMDRDGDAARADDLFKQGEAKPRQSPGIYLDYGRFLLKINRPADAIPQLRKALTFSDMGPDADALLTIALFQSGDKLGACAEAAKVKDAQADILESVKFISNTCPKG